MTRDIDVFLDKLSSYFCKTYFFLILPMLRLRSIKAEICKDFGKKTFKPCRVGIDLIAIAEI